jgi:putative transposase
VKCQTAEVYVSEHRVSIQKACLIVGLSRTAYYRVLRAASRRDAVVIDVLNRVVTRQPR